MAKRRSFGPFVLVFTALSCSMYVACGDDDYVIPPAGGTGGTSDGPGGSAGSSGSGGSSGGGGSAGTGTTPDGGADASIPLDGSVDDAGDDASTSNN
jgi:hypothetical protein